MIDNIYFYILYDMAKCLEKDCSVKRPSFNLPTETKGIYCNIHKKKHV